MIRQLNLLKNVSVMFMFLGTSLVLQASTSTEDVDNTRQNKIYRNSHAKTAEQQSNRKTDIDITRKIRKKLVENDGLSVNAKNIKVITVKGKVKLSGPVNTNEEKQEAYRIARTVVGKNSVTNHLTVKKIKK